MKIVHLFFAVVLLGFIFTYACDMKAQDKPRPKLFGRTYKVLLVSDIVLTGADVVSSEKVFHTRIPGGWGHEDWMRCVYGYRPGYARMAAFNYGETLAIELLAWRLERHGYRHPWALKAARTIQALRVGTETTAVINNTVWLSNH